ncbi:MAG: immunoglobulin domain-containing protein [Candidatus Didemnitutus sp.]|nr:immunoglobulin domain-containing protein [Candidatus Didemnitutus sp.]
MAGLAGTPGSANGDGSAARFNFPAGIAVSAAGSAYIADTANHTIRLGLLPLAPTIQTQPQAVSVPMGNSAQLSVVASGRPAPTYQWRLNGIDIPGATSATYSIAAVRADQAGTYNVVVSNVLGNAVSTGATLTVTGPNQPATEGSTHGGGGAPSLWFFALLAGAAGARWIARRSARR